MPKELRQSNQLKILMLLQIIQIWQLGKSNRTGVSMPFSVVVTEDFKTQNSTL
jgi:hypothetical protein